MPTRLQSLQFSSGNTASDAYWNSMKNFDDMARRDEELARQRQAREFAAQANPIRLQNMRSTATKSAAEAKYAEQNEALRLREREANTEWSVMKAINEAYKSKNYQRGDDTAKKFNVPISPEWRQSQETQDLIDGFMKEGDKRYPNRPLARKQYIESGLPHAKQLIDSGQPYDPTMLFNVPGAPEPDAYEMSKAKAGKPEKTPEERWLETYTKGAGSNFGDPQASAKFADEGMKGFQERRQQRLGPQVAPAAPPSMPALSPPGGASPPSAPIASRAPNAPGSLTSPPAPMRPTAPSAPGRIQYDRPEIGDAREALARVPEQNRPAFRRRLVQELQRRGIVITEQDLEL